MVVDEYFPWGRPGSGAPLSNTRKQRFLETQLHLTSPQRYFAHQDSCKAWERPGTTTTRCRSSNYQLHSPASSGRSSPDRLDKRLWWERGRADHVKDLLKCPESCKDSWARPRLAVASTQSFRVRPRHRPTSSIFSAPPPDPASNETPRINRNALFFCAAAN